MAPLIARIRALFQKNPRIQYALVGVLLVVAIYLVVRSLGGGARAPVTRTPPAAPSGPAATPAPPPALSPPAPGGGASPPAATPVPSPPKTPKEAAVPSGPTGRPDPFIPLFTAPGPPGQGLPPPPFPGQLPPPPLPGQGGVPGFPGAGIAITGIVGDSRSVVIVNVGGKTEILTVGEQIGDMRVLRIDSTRRVVTFLQAGRRFDVAMGGE